MQITNIVPIWQELGHSTNLISQKLAEKLGVKTSHTGTLDPMAEGVIIVLTGEFRNQKYELAKWTKGYEFEIALGFGTDTYDGMGMIKSEALGDAPSDLANLGNILNNFIGPYTQHVPIYSAVRSGGKKLIWHATNNPNVELPKKSGTIFDIKLLDTREVTLNEMVTEITRKIGFVYGSFRQKEIIEQWKKVLQKYGEGRKVTILKIYVETTKGLYIRSLSQDICMKLNEIGFVYSLVRTRNGNFSKENCKMLGDIFKDPRNLC